MDTKLTIQNIADMAGVSKSTVSRYLNEGYISEEKAEKVKKAIAATGFKSNFFAKRLKMRQSKLIGIVLPRMDSVTVGRLFMGINRVLEPAGYQGLLLVSQLQKKRELANIISLQRQGVDGILVDSVGITPEHLQLVKSMTLPMVFTGQQHEAVHYVKLNDIGAGRMMGAYIKQKGHQRVVFAGVTPTDQAVGQERRQGFEEAFRENNPAARVIFVETGFDFRAAYSKGDQILAARPTAVVCATDNIGLGLLRYFHEQGIDVPGEISVAGFGGYDIGAVTYPALTTIAFDYEQAGMRAAQGLLELLEGQEMISDSNLPLFFVERESVRKIDKKQTCS